MGVMGKSGASGGGVAHRGRFLELDPDAAAGGALEGLLGLVVEIVVPQAAAGTPHGGGVGHTGAGARATHPFERRTWPRSTRRTMEGGIVCVDWAAVGTCGRVFASGARFWKDQGRRCSGKGPGKERARFLTRVGTVQGKETLGKGQKEGTCSPFDAGGNVCWEKVFANVSAGADTKANTMGRRRT